jgi:hypothetical protein
MSAFSLLQNIGGPERSQEDLQRSKGNAFADVIMLSGYRHAKCRCKDSQTSADSSFNGRSSGAMTFSFLEAMR